MTPTDRAVHTCRPGGRSSLRLDLVPLRDEGAGLAMLLWQGSLPVRLAAGQLYPKGGDDAVRTTEVFVEQLIIGLLVLGAVGTLVDPELFEILARADLEALALLGAGAYLTGIAWDRIADTLLADLEGHHRLLFALPERDRWKKREVDAAFRRIVAGDPYPEHLYRIALLTSGEAGEYAHYLRTRMRLTRAVATLGPALAAGTAAHLLGQEGGARVLLLGLTSAAGYGGAFVLGLLTTGDPPARSARPPGAGWRPWYRVPKTFDREQLAIYESRMRPPGPKRSRWRWLRLLVTGSWVGPLLLGLTLVHTLILWGEGPSVGALPLGGLLLSLLFGWVWWRISDTFFQFARDHHLHGRAAAPAHPEAAPGSTPSASGDPAEPALPDRPEDHRPP